MIAQPSGFPAKQPGRTGQLDKKLRSSLQVQSNANSTERLGAGFLAAKRKIRIGFSSSVQENLLVCDESNNSPCVNLHYARGN